MDLGVLYKTTKSKTVVSHPDILFPSMKSIIIDCTLCQIFSETDEVELTRSCRPCQLGFNPSSFDPEILPVWSRSTDFIPILGPEF